jgi:hypothetical protein
MEENCGGSQVLNWAVEPRKRETCIHVLYFYDLLHILLSCD